jgi:F-type H+-transporting ATPase subunit b
VPVLLAVAALLCVPAATAGAPRAPQGAAQEAAHEADAGHADEGEHDGWGATIAKAFNFAVLASILVYFLKAPIAGYLSGRSETIRRGLTEAANTRAAAEAQLAGVRAKLAALPAEVEGLRLRGQDELAGERTRMAEATARERQRILDRTRREIGVHLRGARRELLAHTANLAMARARARIERDITPDDQVRLVDRYAAEVRP